MLDFEFRDSSSPQRARILFILGWILAIFTVITGIWMFATALDIPGSPKAITFLLFVLQLGFVVYWLLLTRVIAEISVTVTQIQSRIQMHDAWAMGAKPVGATPFPRAAAGVPPVIRPTSQIVTYTTSTPPPPPAPPPTEAPPYPTSPGPQ